MPAAARYMLDGEPSPPAPMHSDLRCEQLHLAGDADLGQQRVARVARLLIGAQRRCGISHGRPARFHAVKPPASDRTFV